MNRRLFIDIAERVFWTFLQGASSTLILTGFLEIEAWKAAIVGGVAAVLALVKGIAASKVGSPVSAATLPSLTEAVAIVSGQVSGQVMDSTGAIVGEVSGTVEGAVEEAMALLDSIDIEEKRLGRKRGAKRSNPDDGNVP